MMFTRVVAVIVRYWWLVVFSTLLVSVSVEVVSLRQPATYGASTIIELQPRSTLTQPVQVTNAIEAIQNKTVPTTLAHKATASSVQEQVAKRLNVPIKVLTDASLGAAVLPDTGLIEIHAQSVNGTLAAALTNTTAQVLGEQLTMPLLQTNIVNLAAPSTLPLDSGKIRAIALGVFLGVVLGMVLAFLADGREIIRVICQAFLTGVQGRGGI